MRHATRVRILLAALFVSIAFTGLAQEGTTALPASVCASLPGFSIPASAIGLPTGGAVLQAGSFKQSTEAEKMQAQLALVGISAKIQRASVDDETWYRVRIGPIATVEELQVIQSKLREAEISATAVTPDVSHLP